MNSRSKPRPLLLVIAAVLASSAWAADPWVSVPSTPTGDQRLVLSGGHLGPSAPVSIRITHPSGATTVHTAVADAGGKLKFEYTLAAPGGYGVEIRDASGKLIGSGRLGNMR